MIRGWTLLNGLLLATLVAAGCNPQTSGPAGVTSAAADRAVPESRYLLTAEPVDSKGVAEIRDTAQDEEEVVVLGRVGGAKDPFIQGVAAFLIVDPSMPPCDPNCGCPTPWDYCCDVDELLTKKAMVKVVDDKDQVVPVDARELLGIKELATVVVHGKAKRDGQGNLTVLADGIYLKP